MKLRLLFVIGWTACLAPAQQPSCRPVQGDRILAGDLAAALPEFGAAPADAMVGQSPLPGTKRTFHISELRALAHRFGVTLASDQEVCFVWPTAPVDRTRALAAMRESLATPGATIEIKETSAGGVPTGRLDFPLSGLGTPPPSGPSAPVLWRGDVVYDGDSHRFPIWARVEIAVPCQKFLAAESLKAGRPVEAKQIRVRSATCFPIAGKPQVSIGQIAGMTPIHSIAAGTELRPELLTPPNDVNRGDAVQIVVHSGATRLTLTANALNGGRTGDLISVRNPESNKTFQARITGKDTAVIDAGGSRGI